MVMILLEDMSPITHLTDNKLTEVINLHMDMTKVMDVEVNTTIECFVKSTKHWIIVWTNLLVLI